MASQKLGSRYKNDNKAKATRGLRSLAAAVALPLALTIFIIYNFGSGKRYYALAGKPFWLPPLWLIHLASIGSSLLMSLAAWLVWVDGGFHGESVALPLYIAQVSLSIVWDPLVLVIGSASMGFVCGIIHFGTLVACHRSFKRFNPFAQELVKPCLAWTAFLTIVSFKLVGLQASA